MPVQPYLFFEGRAEEAIELYKTVLNAEVVTLFRHKDAPPQASNAALPPNSENKIMHAELKIGGGSVMISDGMCNGAPNFAGFYLSFATPDDASAHAIFNALADGGRVTQPMMTTFFSSSFGMCVDKFGAPWMILTHPK